MVNKKVIIYTTPYCVYCKAAKEFFKEKNVSYEEHDVLADLSRRQEMVEISGQLGVPVITIDGSVVIGFDRPKLVQLLGL